MKYRRIVALILSLLTLVCCFSGCVNTGTTDTEQNNSTDNNDNQNKQTKKIAFTFDDGPQAPTEDLDECIFPSTLYILDKLEELKMKATFFVVGTRVSSYPKATKKAEEIGCEIGIHNYDHSTSYMEMTNSEIKNDLDKAAAKIQSAGCGKTNVFRPRGGAIDQSRLTFLSSLGYSSVGWSLDTLDYENRPAGGWKYSTDPEKKQKYDDFVNEKVELIVNNVKDGDIILMHDIYVSSADIFCKAADILVEQGYEFVTVSELLDLNGKEAQPIMYTSKYDYVTEY